MRRSILRLLFAALPLAALIPACSKVMGPGDPVETARTRLNELEKKIETYKEKKHQLKVESIFRRKKAERLEKSSTALKATIQKFATELAAGAVTVSMFGKNVTAEQVKAGIPAWHRSYLRLERERQLMQTASDQFGQAAETMDKHISSLETNLLNLRMKVDELELLRDEARVRKDIQDVMNALSGTGGKGEISEAVKAIEDQIDRLGAEMEASGGTADAEVPSAAELIFMNESWGAGAAPDLDDTSILAEYGIK